jgi:hypothetical protein
MNLVQKSLDAGGRISPLIIEDGFYKHIGYMNPSIFVDDDGDILVNLRHINYTLYHSEGQQIFPSRWGPLSYLHPEQDQTLRTVNYICRLDDNLQMINHTMIDTTLLDVTPMWHFIGEEDGRLVQWDGDYYLIGVRRDTTTTGQGRMELSKLDINKDTWSAKEVSRLRIPTTGDNDSYCEKNWVPILDKPYHFIKWTSPTEVVRTYPELPARCEQLALNPGKQTPVDQRGGSQIVKWGAHYIGIPHEVYLFNNYLGQKDGIYRHRLCVWNENFELVGYSPEPLSFMEGRVEFCAGAAKYGDDLLVSFGFQDNSAFVLQIPNTVINELIEQALNV